MDEEPTLQTLNTKLKSFKEAFEDDRRHHRNKYRELDKDIKSLSALQNIVDASAEKIRKLDHVVNGNGKPGLKRDFIVMKVAIAILIGALGLFTPIFAVIYGHQLSEAAEQRKTIDETIDKMGKSIVQLDTSVQFMVKQLESQQTDLNNQQNYLK